MARRIPGLPEHWQHYVLCLVFHLLLPLLPLGVELLVAQKVSVSSLSLSVAMYSISIGGSSKSRLQFGLSVVICIAYSIVFGLTVPGAPAAAQVSQTLANSSGYGAWALLFIFVYHALERYNRHVVDRAPYWEFVAVEATKQ